MRRGFTLIELQVSLMLTMAMLGALFLFSFYFWQNFHRQTEYLAFHRQVDQFLDWHDRTLGQASQVVRQGDRVQMTDYRGEVRTLEVGPSGPLVAGTPFFSSPVEMELKYTIHSNICRASIQITQLDLQVTRTWELSYKLIPARDLRQLL